MKTNEDIKLGIRPFADGDPAVEVVDDVDKELAALGPVHDMEPEAAKAPAPTDTPPKVEDKKDESKPPVAAPATPPPAEDEDDLPPELKDVKNPSPDNWKKAQDLIKSLKKEKRELAKQTPPAPPAPVAPVTAPPAAPVAKGTEVTPEQTFRWFADAHNERFDSPEKNKDVASKAAAVIAALSTTELLSVIEQARTGAFGEDGAVIIQTAQQHLPEAQARESKRNAEQAQAEQRSQKFMTDVRASFEKVATTYPEMKDGNSELSKFVKTWREKNVAMIDPATQRFVAPFGPYAFLIGRPDWPERVMELASTAFKASRVNTLEAERDDFRKKYETIRSPEVGSRGANVVDPTKSPTEPDQVDKELIALGKVGPTTRN